MADLKAEIAKAIADACEIEESVAEFGASAVLALPEIRDALEPLRCNDCGDEVSCAVCCGCAAMGA